MKLRVTNNGQDIIQGYKNITVNNEQINFEDVCDNECELILANDILDSFNIHNIETCIRSLINKLRLGGSLVVGGTDLRLFCKNVISDQIKDVEGANTIGRKRSMSDFHTVSQIVSSLGLKIQTVQTSGIHYEIRANRQ